MRTTAIVSTLALGGALLTGCGGGGGSSSTSGYCDDLKDAKAEFSSLNSSTPDFKEFSKAIDTFHEIADGAPEEVADDWELLDDALTKLEKDLDSAGLTLEDLGTITKGGVPEGMTPEELQQALPKLQSAFSSLSSSDLEKASTNIEKHAKSECDIDLTDS